MGENNTSWGSDFLCVLVFTCVACVLCVCCVHLGWLRQVLVSSQGKKFVAVHSCANIHGNTWYDH